MGDKNKNKKPENDFSKKKYVVPIITSFGALTVLSKFAAATSLP
ncbi:MAG: hypothetical protein ACYCPQ_00030 [Elusimicrobiota bacterium]